MEEDDDKFWGQCHLRLLLRYQTEIGSDSVQLFDQLAKGWVPGTPSASSDSQAIMVVMDDLRSNRSYLETFEALRADCLYLGSDASTRIALNLSMDKFWPEIRIDVDRSLRSGGIACADGQDSGH